nr:hypothetical protein BaRGS_005947 [Batillaria attramentaria]
MSSVLRAFQPPCLAVNGDTGTEWNLEPPNCVHSAQYDYSAWWEVDLGRDYIVQRITVFRHEFAEFPPVVTDFTLITIITLVLVIALIVAVTTYLILNCAKPCNTPTQGATSEPFYDIPADTSPQDVPTRTPIRRKQAGVSDGSGSSVNEIQHEQRHDYSWSDRDHGCFLDVEALIHSLPNIVIPPGQSQSHSYLTLVPDPEPPGHTSAGTAETIYLERYVN